MPAFDELLLAVRRGDSLAARALRDAYGWAQRWNLPDAVLNRKLFAALYHGHDTFAAAREFAASKLLYEPMARARFHRVGLRLRLSALPFVRGHAHVTVGDDCDFGYFSVRSGRFLDQPELVFGDSVHVSSNVTFVVNRRITIGNHTGIAGRCWLSDTDGHPVDPERRERNEELTAADIQPLTIGNHVWVGHACHILKGVTIGDGAVVAAGSVVTSDIPPGTLAMGVPARIVRPW